METKTVVIVGAGPAGLFAAGELANQGIRAVVLNRDIKPGGLAEYGIYPEKLKMKQGLRQQFRRVLQHPLVTYLGGVTVGKGSPLCLEDLRERADALLVAVGAQGTKWLGIPGEHLKGVYHAKHVAFYYNSLPPYSLSPLDLGDRVAIVGAGNVMTDIATYLIQVRKVKELHIVARRGPGEVKFERKEFERIVPYLDLAHFRSEIERVKARLEDVGQNTEEATAWVYRALERAESPSGESRLQMHFMRSPKAVLADDQGHAWGLEFEENRLVREDGGTRAQGLGTYGTLAVDGVIFAIGDCVDAQVGLPVAGNAFAIDPRPRFPVEGESYEAYDPQAGKPLDGFFVTGWARRPSHGLVGEARREATNASRAILKFLEQGAEKEARTEDLKVAISGLSYPVVTMDDLKQLERAETQMALQLGLDEFKFADQDEMLRAMRLGSAG
jgi:ferredoxin--NADP+ reductase